MLEIRILISLLLKAQKEIRNMFSKPEEKESLLGSGKALQIVSFGYMKSRICKREIWL